MTYRFKIRKKFTNLTKFVVAYPSSQNLSKPHNTN